jgi:hypothetical protein
MLPVDLDLPPVLLPGDEHGLTAEEACALRGFVFSNAQTATLESLRDSWGLCDRHSWGEAIVEIELSRDDDGQHDRSPFALATLYEDLLTFMTYRLTVGRSRLRGLALRGTEECLICAELLVSEPPERPDGNVLAELHAMHQSGRRVRRSARLWQDKVCPECAEEAKLARTAAERCRPHLVAAGRTDAETAAELVDQLRNTRYRLRELLNSRSTEVPVTPEGDSSWIEALGWFHGWGLPLALNARPVRAEG